MSLSPEQVSVILNAFRSKVADFLSEDLLNDDHFLMRWLIAREYNVEKAACMLKNHMKWREENQIDKILEWEAPADIKEACPYELSFRDHDGRPVVIFPWARWTPWDFTDTGRKDEYVKYVYQILEKCVAATQKSGEGPPGFVILADSDGFGLWMMSKVRSLETNLGILRAFESNYPEMLNLAIVVNCPRVFSIMYSIIKPLMSRRTLEKLKLFDSNKDKWTKCLVEHIPEGDLPEKYGGQNDCFQINLNNNPRREVVSG